MELTEILKSPEKAFLLIQNLTGQVEDLQEKLRLALFRKFGRSSEKIDANQTELFEELETIREEVGEEGLEKKSEVMIPSHTRKRAGRKPLDASLPREEILHDLPEDEKHCACGHRLVEIGREAHERLNVIPEQMYVEKHLYPKYACKNCEGSGDEERPAVRKAQAEPSLIPGSIVTPGLLAFLLVNKFVDHLPFYRQEKRFERIGARISRQNMSNWALTAYETLRELKHLFIQKIKEGPFIQMDETPVQVLNEQDRPNTSQSFMWLARGGPPETPIVFYAYHPNKSAAFVEDFLTGYEGFLQTDGNRAYDKAVGDKDKITQVGCLAHVRRKFFEASKASKRAGSALKAVNFIKEIYRMEDDLRSEGLSREDFLQKRKQTILPKLRNFKTWLDEKAMTVRPTSKTGEAVGYALGQWEKIENYIDCYELTPDNNGAENAIRPFVLGRKNWLFSGSPTGAKASCFFYSLIETAKHNGLNPHLYLAYLFQQAPFIKDQAEWKKLLPWNCKERVKISR